MAFTDNHKEELIESNLVQLSTEEIEELAYQTKAFTIAASVIVIVVDFLIRFLVIDALYHKFRDEGKPRQEV
jgi:hypothetical protein